MDIGGLLWDVMDIIPITNTCDTFKIGSLRSHMNVSSQVKFTSDFARND